jgi:uncharacterized membrane protein
MRRLFLLAIAVTVISLALPASLNAQSPEWIKSFDSKITINQDNSADITETIVYDFGASARHGIERFVAHQNKTDGNKYYYYSVDFTNTKQNDRIATTKIYDQGDNTVLRIGDPDTTVSGIQTYVIHYTLKPVIQTEQSNDYLNLDITGNQWNVTILKTTARISFEGNVAPTKIECYSGDLGSKDQSVCSVKNDSKIVSLENNLPVEPGSGVTTNILLPKDSYNNYLMAQDKPLPNLWPAVGPLMAVVLIIFGTIIRFKDYAKHKRLQKSEVIVPQYEAPDNLSPGEVGQLSDNSSDMSEITASIISLAVKGFIRIEQLNPKTIFKKAKYRFHNLKQDTTRLPQHEIKLLHLVTPSGSETNDLDKISASNAQTTVLSVKKILKQQLESKGYYSASSSPTKINWKIVIGVGGAITVVANIIALLVGNTEFIYIFLSIAAALIGGGIAETVTKQTTVTESGYDKWAEVEGLKMYLQVAEKDRLDFHDAPEKSPKIFNQLLPYAIALGVEEKWAKQFESLNINEQSTDWYSGNGNNLSTAAFVSSLSSDFGGAVSSGFTPAQSSGSSSGGSGGGFSGGGIGGGGGGSW